MQKAFYLHAPHLARSKKTHMFVCAKMVNAYMREISLNPRILILS